MISYNRDSFDWHQVNPEMIGEFTGTRDKNDLEIYENDICNSGYFKLHIVDFYNSGWHLEEFMEIIIVLIPLDTALKKLEIFSIIPNFLTTRRLTHNVINNHNLPIRLVASANCGYCLLPAVYFFL